ncbi:hypothetical protein G9A89_005278 [Geosiphon pyriformis]|nr:hypothetical protein G9A89_005278 [Geosiphon pyriformis]
MAIPINCHIDRPFLFISGVLITIARKRKSHHYLGIFFLTEDLSKSSLVKAHLDIRFFSNMVLKKAVSDKQFLYLVSAVLYLIVSFRTQFNALIRKSLKLKSGLLSDFPSNTIHHPFFYGLKFFIQIQLEGKVTSLICFANSGGVLVLCWHPVHPLCLPVYIYVSPSNNFLTDLVCILLKNSLSLGGYLGNSFLLRGGVPISTKRLDPCGLVPKWFQLSTMFLSEVVSIPSCPSALDAVGLPSIVSSQMYTDGSLKGLGTSGCRTGAGVFFKDIGLGLGVSVLGSMSSTLAEMQAIALALECVPPSKLGLICPDFRNQCWIKRQHIVKSHSRILGNDRANMIADAVSFSAWCLFPYLNKRFLIANSGVVSANSRHFLGQVQSSCLIVYFLMLIDIAPHLYGILTRIWPLGLLAMAVRKRLYDRRYPSVLCLHCGEVEVSDHVFVCEFDCDSYVSSWSALSGLSVSSSGVLQLLFTCVSDVSVSMALFKDFVFDGWYHEAVFFSSDPKLAHLRIVEFVWSLGAAFRTKVWLVCVKYYVFMEKNDHILSDGSVPVLISGLGSKFSVEVVRLLGVAEAIGVHFGYYKQCVFFSGVDNSVVVHINV